MPYDAFISYCSEDKKIADAVCGTLEANKIRAPDVPHVEPKKRKRPVTLWTRWRSEQVDPRLE